jgi:hypothetical protein
MTKTLYQKMETELDSSLYLSYEFNKIEKDFLRITNEWLKEMQEQIPTELVTHNEWSMWIYTILHLRDSIGLPVVNKQSENEK